MVELTPTPTANAAIALRTEFARFAPMILLEARGFAASAEGGLWYSSQSGLCAFSRSKKDYVKVGEFAGPKIFSPVNFVTGLLHCGDG